MPSSKIGAMDRDHCSPPPTPGIEWEIVELFEREAAGISRYARALGMDQGTADDALQEAFFRFFLCRSAGQQIRSPKGWLFRVVHNYVLDQYRAGSHNNVGIESLANLPCAVSHSESDSHVSDLLRELPRIGLSAREVECVRLRTEDLSYEEIAGVLGLQVGTVGALLARAHGKIRKAAGDRDHKGHDFGPALVRVKGYAS
jgi:RNA polymerase sigma-70 factor (ECF subfamily)